MLVADVLALECEIGPQKLVQATPATMDCPARPKRKRTCGSYDPCSEAASAGQPQGGAPLTAGAASPAPALEPSPASVPWAASFLFDYVHQCLDNLSSMHAACLAIQRDTRAAAMACAIFRRSFLRRDQSGQAALVRERLLAGALLAASLWLAIKFEATRTTTPDANLMSRISGIPAGLLRQQERQVLADLGWDLMTPAREAGAVALPDLTDEVCRDQQEQLAALAALQLTTSSMHVPRPQPAAAGRAAWRAADLASRPHSAQQVVCSNLLAPPEEHQECFPSAAGGACDLESWSGGAPTSALAALGW